MFKKVEVDIPRTQIILNRKVFDLKKMKNEK